MSSTEKTTSLSKTAVWTIALSLALTGGAALMLFVFDPSRSPIYPVCHFHRLTGWHCPGCGSLRALHHLTHGELMAAFRSNPLLVTALPVLAWLAWRSVFRKRNRPTPLPNFLKSAAPWIALGAMVLFGILRNLPHPAFSWMSP
jgi:hypothetical protein